MNEKDLPFRYRTGNFDDRPLTRAENIKVTLVLIVGIGVWVGIMVWLWS